MIDLFDEASEDLSAFGYETEPLLQFGATCNRLVIDSEIKARKLGFEQGKYFILNAPLLSLLVFEHEQMLVKELSKRISALLEENGVSKKTKILLVGVGNPKIVADSFGVRCVEKIENKPFKKDNRIFKIMPNVFANTGLNCCDILKLLVKGLSMEAVILFDSIATNNISRLGTSLQFNSSGLTPGSAMNNFGLAINKKTLQVPCFALGVPLMIASENLTSQKSGIILTEKDAKEKVEFLSSIVAKVFNKIL